MHGYYSTCIYYFISFFSLLSVSLVALTLIVADHQRTPHHASTKNTTSKNFFQNQVKQEISLHRICLVAEKNTEKTRNKEN